MGKIKRTVAVVSALLIGLGSAYLAILMVASLNQGYSWQEMDWHQRGTTSIGDFFEASEIGKREISQGSKKCVEYFSYKDGLAIKVVCSE